MGCGEEERRMLKYKNDSCSKIISNATRDTDALDDWHLHRPSGGQVRRCQSVAATVTERNPGIFTFFHLRYCSPPAICY